MKRIRSLPNASLLAGAAATAFCSIAGPAQGADNPSSYAAFVAALSAFAVSSSDAIQNERNAARLEFVRREVTKKVLAAFPVDPAQAPATDPNNTLSLSGVLSETSFLCDFRWMKTQVIVKNISGRDNQASITVDHLNTLAQLNYLTVVASKLQALAASSDPTDIFSAFKALFADYQIKVAVQPTVADSDREQTKKSCEADLKEFDAAYFGDKIPAPPAPAALPAGPVGGAAGDVLGLLGPFGSLASSIIGIVEPVVLDFAKLALNFEKKQKVKEFLSDGANQAKLRDAGLAMGRTTSDYLFAKRLSLAGTFAEQIALVTGDPVDLTSKEVQAACPAPHSAMYSRGSDGLPTAQFRRCYHAVWKHFEEGVAAALKTAAAYDQLADAGNTSTALNNYRVLTNEFSTIANDSGQVDVWDTASKILTFASAIKTAVSDDNVKKLQQAFDAVAKGK